MVLPSQVFLILRLDPRGKPPRGLRVDLVGSTASRTTGGTRQGQGPRGLKVDPVGAAASETKGGPGRGGGLVD